MLACAGEGDTSSARPVAGARTPSTEQAAKAVVTSWDIFILGACLSELMVCRGPAFIHRHCILVGSFLAKVPQGLFHLLLLRTLRSSDDPWLGDANAGCVGFPRRFVAGRKNRAGRGR